jgi:uncharacterized membrane protein
MSERKLRAWQEAGLIDEAAAARILAFEAQHERPLGLWAVIGIGALAIGLGVVSVAAANWEAVPGLVRLAVHLALIGALTTFLALRGERLGREHPWGLEAALFVLAMLGIAFFSHLGQVYQTSSPIWQPLAVWLVLFAPLLLLRGQSWPAAALLFSVLLLVVWDFAWTIDSPLVRREGPPDRIGALATALPVMLAPLAAWMRQRSTRAPLWERLEEFAIFYAVGGASLVCLAASVTQFGSDGPTFGGLTIRAGVAIAAAALLALVRPGRSGHATAMVLAGAGAATFLAHPLSGAGLAPGLLFMALWVGIAAAALHAGWRGVFQLAVALVALRLIALSFELASDLLTSGFGLILAGLLILAVAWGAVRVSRRFAPPRGDGA